MTNLYGSICLSDIKREWITESNNGKKYLNIEVKQMRQPSKFGATHTVKVSIKREQRKENDNYYIGNLKVSQYGADANVAALKQDAATPVQQVAEAFNAEVINDDLPF